MAIPLEILCVSERFCSTCRDREGGREWRQQLGRAYELPADAPDFVCPHGREWGATKTASKLRGLGDVVAAVTKWLGLRECESCEKRREALNRAVPFRGDG